MTLLCLWPASRLLKENVAIKYQRRDYLNNENGADIYFKQLKN